MFYYQLTQICKKRGISLTTLLKDLNMSTGNLSKWKNGNIPKIDTIIKIVQYFNVSIDYFFHDVQSVADMNQVIGEYSSVPKVPVFYDNNLSVIDNNKNCNSYRYEDIKNSEEYFYLKVSDNEMARFGIVFGSLVLIHRNRYVNPNELVCYIYDDKIWIKKFVLKKNVVILMSDNPENNAIVVGNLDVFYKKYLILGVAKEVKTEFA